MWDQRRPDSRCTDTASTASDIIRLLAVVGGGGGGIQVNKCRILGLCRTNSLYMYVLHVWGRRSGSVHCIYTVHACKSTKSQNSTTCTYMYMYMYSFALFVCLTLLASFFLPSHLSFKNMYMYMYIHGVERRTGSDNRCLWSDGYTCSFLPVPSHKHTNMHMGIYYLWFFLFPLFLFLSSPLCYKRELSCIMCILIMHMMFCIHVHVYTYTCVVKLTCINTGSSLHMYTCSSQCCQVTEAKNPESCW